MPDISSRDTFLDCFAGSFATISILGTMPRFVRRYTAHNPPADQAIISDPDFRAMYLANFVEAYRQGPEAFADEVILCSKRWGFELSEIRVPIHFWHGELDNSTPLGMSSGMAERVAGGKLTILPGQGHMFVYGELWGEILGDLLATKRSATSKQEPREMTIVRSTSRVAQP